MTMDLITALESPQGTNLLAGIAVANPGLYFFMKHWSKILSLFLILVIVIGVGGMWQYNKHLSNKFDRVNSELIEYKDKYDSLKESYIFLQDELIKTREEIDKFNKDVASIRHENARMRERIALLNINKSPSVDNQKQLDDLRKDINEKWKSI